MIPIPDLVALSGARNAKMVLAGDSGQLQAVQNGGAMSLLAVALGYVLLADRAAPTAPRRGGRLAGLDAPGMSKARLVVTAAAGRTVSFVGRAGREEMPVLLDLHRQILAGGC